MNISAALLTTIVFSFNRIGSCTLLGAKKSTENIDDNSLARKLWNPKCCWNDKCREPGQWLEGSTLSCMCSKSGDGNWVKCQKNKTYEPTSTPTKPPDKRCWWGDECRYPGEWFEWRTKSCMCSKSGDGNWVKCKQKTYKPTPTPTKYPTYKPTPTPTKSPTYKPTPTPTKS
eukprot:CAMPEP_0194275908 /NCGR_PEP_ID=MMETSP0169-20130528/8629_1 /TAXON_ID=218684 /ORGANISM="Corethron pennatum, Strain L29A3" /LENGTH=171 /DNA_ID=CAMNT_0039019495 /DNA_START=240 /DNA_END=751 /DNA_ORIENTATION=+